MIPILGITASSTSASKTGSFESIATTTLGSGQTTVTFNSIPSTYAHLQVRASISAAASNRVLVRITADTANDYAWHRLYGDGSTASAAGSSSGTSSAMRLFNDSNAPTATSTFGPVVLDILDYTSTNKLKTMRALCGWDANGTGGIEINSGWWIDALAITSLSFIMDGSTTYNAGTTFALYGIKGA